MKVIQPKKAIIEFSEEEVNAILKVRDILLQADEKITSFDAEDISWEVTGVGIDNLIFSSDLEDISCFCHTITKTW